MGIILIGLGYILKKPLLYLFGASDRTFPFADQYTSWYLIGTIFVMLALGLNAFITAQGKSKIAMFSVLIGAITNIVLDPVFIFLLNLGVKGAAIATVISQGVSALFVLRFLSSEKSIIRLRKENLRPDPAIAKRIYINGSGTFIMTSTESAITLVFNRGLLNYGADIYVGGMTIMQSVMQLLVMPINGFSMGVQPLISYNYGAENKQRVRDTIKYSLIIVCSVIVAYCTLVQLFPGLFARIFSSDMELISLVKQLLPIYMLGMFLFGLQMVAQMVLWAPDKPVRVFFQLCSERSLYSFPWRLFCLDLSVSSVL